MFYKLLNLGLLPNLDFEESIRVKFLNAASIIFSIILYFFIGYHSIYTHKYDTVVVLFLIAVGVGSVFLLQYKYKYGIAKFIFFFLLHLVVFTESMFLSPGRGNESFYLSVVILLLIQTKNKYWLIILIGINAVLFILPQLIYTPYPKENYSIITALAVFFAIMLSVRFFILIQNQYKELLNDKNKTLAKLNSEKNDLMSIVAHDLKTPLAQIRGLVNILELESTQLSEEQIELLTKIKGVTENQRDQITNFLDAKALDEKINAITFKEFDLITKVQSIIESFKVLSSSKNIEIIDRYDSEKINVVGSSDCIEKIISNLLSNAIKYSYSDSKVIIDVRSDKRQVIIMITDFGQGFKKEDLRLVFVKNQTLSATPTADETTSGVGLYIVKKYVDMIEGWVWLKSVEGKGTTFFVKFARSLS